MAVYDAHQPNNILTSVTDESKQDKKTQYRIQPFMDHSRTWIGPVSHKRHTYGQSISSISEFQILYFILMG